MIKQIDIRRQLCIRPSLNVRSLVANPFLKLLWKFYALQVSPPQHALMCNLNLTKSILHSNSLYTHLALDHATADHIFGKKAFHGTWWYSVWQLLLSGVLLQSKKYAKGHDFWEPGVYCTPLVSTAKWYARPHIVFGDGVYHCIMYELRVDPSKIKTERERGGVQWVFPSSAVMLHAVWVATNSSPRAGEQRVDSWDVALEVVPRDCDFPHPISNGNFRRVRRRAP